MWNEHFWLPRNTTWRDFVELEQQGIRVPRFQDLLYVYPLAGVLYILRLLFERYIAQPIGRSLSIREFSKRSKHDTPPLAKFSESFWRFVFYLSVFIYGLVILNDVNMCTCLKSLSKKFFSF